MTINTAKVAGRRKLHFSCYQDMLDDVHRLAAQPTRQLGNWSLDQVCQHLAGTLDLAIDGPSFKAPLYLRLIGPLVKKSMLKRPMPPGYTVPSSATTLIPAPVGKVAGVAALEKAVARLAQNTERKSHPIFGRMNTTEWDQFELRHAEMHLSFIVPA